MAIASLWALAVCAACGTAVARPSPGPPAEPPPEPGSAEAADAPAEPIEAAPGRQAPPELPRGREIAALGPEGCLALLDASGVRYEVVEAEEAPGVAIPVLLRGPVGGIEVTTAARGRSRSIMDCRLAVALLAWAPTLVESGVASIDHMSAYRAGARVRRTGRQSGHAAGLALDAGTFVLRDGRALAVEDVWTDRRRGAPPCEPGPEDGDDLRLLRSIVCAAASEDLFQIVLTPHFDSDHRNHVHLEVKPGVSWSCLH